MTIIVHSSLKSLGWVLGGASTVIDALQDTVTSEGTIVMPTQTTNLTTPEYWCNPPIPKNWLDEVLTEFPCFDKEKTPSYRMGAIAELFRTYPNVLRSNHPFYSFAAWGKKASYIITDHSLTYGLGNNSPLGKIYTLNGYILLLGVDHDHNTSMHLGEYRSNIRTTIKDKYTINENNKTVWKYFDDIEYDDEKFLEIGYKFEAEHPISKVKINNGELKLIPQKEIVDYTQNYFETINKL